MSSNINLGRIIMTAIHQSSKETSDKAFYKKRRKNTPDDAFDNSANGLLDFNTPDYRDIFESFTSHRQGGWFPAN
jgi:hypothetical protein